MNNNTGRIVFWRCVGCGRENKIYPDKRTIEVDNIEYNMLFVSGKEKFKDNPYVDRMTQPILGELTGRCMCGHSIKLPVMEERL